MIGEERVKKKSGAAEIEKKRLSVEGIERWQKTAMNIADSLHFFFYGYYIGKPKFQNGVHNIKYK